MNNRICRYPEFAFLQTKTDSELKALEKELNATLQSQPQYLNFLHIEKNRVPETDEEIHFKEVSKYNLDAQTDYEKAWMRHRRIRGIIESRAQEKEQRLRGGNIPDIAEGCPQKPDHFFTDKGQRSMRGGAGAVARHHYD